MSAPRDEEEERVGLCVRCRHVRSTRNDRGSVFYLCRLSERDARFPRYPRLPVRACDGFADAERQGAETGGISNRGEAG